MSWLTNSKPPKFRAMPLNEGWWRIEQKGVVWGWNLICTVRNAEVQATLNRYAEAPLYPETQDNAQKAHD